VVCLKVHEAAKQLGVTPRTLRFYEEKGLIHPHKALENKYRDYSEEDVIRLRWIISLREFGLSISAIQDALNAIDEPEAFIRSVDGARALLYEQWITATKALQALDETISAWQRNGAVELTQAELVAEEIKQNRISRASWSDQWDYDEMAIQHGYKAPIVTLSGILSEEQYNLALLRTVDWLDPRYDELGLELGAGSGNLSSMLAAAGTKLTVVEQSTEMLSIIRDRLPAIDAKQGNLLALPLAASSYSFIGCSFAMHHLNHSQQLLALEEMDRVLLMGGRLVITGLIEEDEDDGDIAARRLAIHSNWHPSSASMLINWFNKRGYSTVTDRLSPYIGLLYAIKP
jgi:putative AdoMet-dependent methyltransferase